MSARVDKNLLRIRDESEFVDGVGRRIEEASKRLELVERQIPELQEGFTAQARDALSTVRGEVMSGVEEKIASLGGHLVESEKKVKDFSTYIARLEAREEQTEKERLAELGKALNAFEVDLKGKLSAAAIRGETLEDEVFARLSARIQEDESAVAKSIQTIEMRLSDYQGDVDYRVKALEESNHDVDALRASLSQTMDKMAAGVRTEMKAMSAELQAGWTAEIAGASAARDQLRAGMAELETGLADLKTRAYQDVEKKLSVFEDEFFADLRARSSAMQEKLQAWQAEMESARRRVRNRREGARHHRGRVHQALRESVRQETEKVKKDASQSFEKDLAGVRDDGGGRDAQDAPRDRGAAQGAGRGAGCGPQGDRRSSSRHRAPRSPRGRGRHGSSWPRRSSPSRRRSPRSPRRPPPPSARSGTGLPPSGRISSCLTNEERTALREELSDMGASIAAYKAELTRSTDAAMETLRAQLDAFQLESQKRVRDVQAEIEGRIKEHKQQLTDAREKSEAMQEKLFGKIEESYRLLSVNITEIDKRVKNFLSQTRLFERADSLKAALEGTIDEMKKEMAKLNADRSEIAEIEVQLSRTKKVADEVSVKLTRFLSEKRRIEEMDGDFKKIMALSRDVDLKINTLSSSNDALQQIQAKIRQFEDMGKAVEGGFERLEKKREILSITSEGVDRNFQRLEGIEKSLQEADRAADDLSGKVQDLRSEYDTLAGNKKDADSAMETVGKLNGIMAELEARLEKAQSSREWMARTETRFEEIGRQAQEQVRLLESIIKAETKKEKPDRGRSTHGQEGNRGEALPPGMVGAGDLAGDAAQQGRGRAHPRARAQGLTPCGRPPRSSWRPAATTTGTACSRRCAPRWRASMSRASSVTPRQPATPVLLKPNLLMAAPAEKGVTTHPSVFAAVARVFQENGARLTYGDSPNISSRPLAAARRCGLFDEAEALGIPLADFENGEDVSFPRGMQDRRFHVARGALDAGAIVSLPRLKTHAFTVMTGALKNTFGVVPGGWKAQYHVSHSNMDDFSRMIVDLNGLVLPRLVVMDAVKAMQGNGPGSGDLVDIGLLIVSDDPVAADAVGCRIMGIDPMSVPQVRIAHESGLGNAHPESIDLRGENIAAYVRHSFKVPPGLPASGSRPLPSGSPEAWPRRNWLSTGPSARSAGSA